MRSTGALRRLSLSLVVRPLRETPIMIPKHRNRGIVQLVCAIGLTALLIYLVSRRRGLHTSDNWVVFGILLYVACWAMWMFASFSLARAKGYGPDYFGAILIFLYIFAFCFPVALFVFPAVAIFGLKDKTKERRW